MTVINTTDGMDDAGRRERLYAGDVIIFRQLPGMVRLTAHARNMARQAFGSAGPVEAHRSMQSDAYIETVTALQKRFTNDTRIAGLFRDALVEAGINPDKSYWDWFPMRVQPPNGKHLSSVTQGLGVHRDTWYGCPAQQNNWWGPIFPLQPDRSLAFYPSYWSRPIGNNTDGWSIDEFRSFRAAARAEGASFEELEASYYRPTATDIPEDDEEFRLDMAPGDLVCFSAAHLHAGVPNITRHTRFSTEVRMVHIDDIKEGRGAPNQDNASTGTSVADFKRIAGGEPLSKRL